MRKHIALAAATAALAAGAVVGVQPTADASCGSGCHGSWTWSEFTALDGKWNQAAVQQLCNCDGIIVTGPVNDRKTVEYNNYAFPDRGWVAIYYNKWGDGQWHATAKEWGKASGDWVKYQL